MGRNPPNVYLHEKFVQSWPFLGRVRLSFVQPPYFLMTETTH